MSKIIEEATTAAFKVGEEVSKINAVAGLLLATGTLLSGIAALGVKEIVLKAMDKDKKN